MGGEGLAGASSLSVVIVAYRSGPVLGRCLSALRKHSPEAEVVVVDNDGREEVSEDVKLLRPGKNLGFAGGCNLGASEAVGPILVFLNPDAVVSEGALDRLAARLADPEVGIAMARVCLLDRPDELNSGGTMIHVSGLAWAGRFGEPASSIAEPEDVPAASGAALAVRSAVFRELGGFTDELFMYHEDVELSWRAHLQGLRVVIEPCADVLHDYDFGRNAAKIALLERNRLIFVLTAYSPRLLLVLAPVLALGELAMLVVAARGGWFRGKLGGWWWVMSHPRWLMSHRRETQRLRTVRDRELACFLTPTLDPKVASVPRGVGFLNRLLGPYWSVARRAL